MLNFTDFYNNKTQVSVQNSKLLELRIMILTPNLISFCCFLYIVAIMLNVFFTTPHVRDNARYILFAHMIINDLIYLVIAISLFLLGLFLVTVPVTVCYFVLIISSSSFKVTPFNLAVMSLERYVAICIPLRHAEFCTKQRTGNMIAIIWIMGLIPQIADFIILTSSVHMDYFSQSDYCSRSIFLNTESQNMLRSAMHAMTFSLVALVIVFTYVRIMLVAKKIDSAKGSASKASKTVMLHAIQLLLCLLAFTYPITETYLKGYMFPIINFSLFMCLPRFISPLIYGIRDDAFRTCITRYVFCRSVKINVDQFTH
ncbi:odorant receptor 131-2-like [Pelobates fuscus]|uniref:odorant receptor 131-2-like n=1 Tax=Pelobates fuscus TaxID=191477 RepID=UPI002FE4BD2B